jgi:hypothetical protein
MYFIFHEIYDVQIEVYWEKIHTVFIYIVYNL